MKLFYPFFCIIMITSMAAPAAAADINGWRYALGYAYLNNAEEIRDSYKHLSRDAENEHDIFNTSVSICFQPYYQFKNGCRAGAGIGPLVLLVGDAFHVQVPVNLTLGYSFFKDSEISPYIRTGISFHMVSGDYYKNSLPGFFGSIGIEFFNTKPLHIGFETAYDASEIKLDRLSGQAKHEKIKTGELTFFIYADF